MQTSLEGSGGQTTQYAFTSFHALPCGCITGVYRTRPWDVEVVALEAQGPHCHSEQHAVGTVLGLGMSAPDRLIR